MKNPLNQMGILHRGNAERLPNIFKEVFVMRTKTKALVLALCAVLLVVTTVFVTMAFLTSEDSVQNTFTVGKVTIILNLR